MKNKTVKTPTSGDVAAPKTRSGYSKSATAKQTKMATAFKTDNNKEKIRGSFSKNLKKMG